MAKTKKSKKANADAVHAKKANGVGDSNPFATAKPMGKKINPFEVHVNKEKFQILGRTCKHDKGLPGVSRGKAMQKRKETLGREFSDKHKTNQFRDRRIGKHLQELTEEVATARFVADKMSQMRTSKTSRFNLNDDEVLTHRGQTLEEIEQFRDDRSDDGDAEDERLDAEFTEAAHFGGDEAPARDRKTAIEEMIHEQKKRKNEIAKEKEEIYSLTEKLDSTYKDLISLVNKNSRKDMQSKPPLDEYDKVLREMVFEPRGHVSDKLISEEEVAKQAKERLEKLENERLRRMREEDEQDTKNARPTHRSADDLDDGYFANGEQEEEEGTLAYNMDGQLGTGIGDKGGNETAEPTKEESAVELEVSDEEEKSDEEEESDEEEDSDEGDNLSDLKESESEEEAAKETGEKPKSLTKKAKASAEVCKKLPYTIEMPDTYEDFVQLLAPYASEDKATIVERLIKCNHPKLEGVNREKVVKLFAFLLQFIDELFADATPTDICGHFDLLDKLNPHLFDLVVLNPEKMSLHVSDVIKQKYAEYRRTPKSFPPLEVIVFFKLVSNFYSTSDFRHPIVTPCYIFMQHILSQARVRTRQDVALGLLLVTIVLEYAQLSKRFLPAAFNFLRGVVYLSVPKRPVEVIPIVPPFPTTGIQCKLLTISEFSGKGTLAEELILAEDFVLTTLSPEFKVRALNTALKLSQEAVALVSGHVGANYLAQPLVDILERLPLDPYPDFVRRNCDATLEALRAIATQALTKIVPPEKKPKALRLLEPRFEAVYDDKRRPKLTQEKEERVKMQHKIRRATKGAVREIRRDTHFLQSMRMQQQMESDRERREKVKRIYQEASMQQGELNELARLKKKKKF